MTDELTRILVQDRREALVRHAAAVRPTRSAARARWWGRRPSATTAALPPPRVVVAHA